MIYIPRTNAEAIGEELTIKGHTVLRSKEPTSAAGAKAALIKAMLDRKTAHIDKLSGAGILRTSTLLDVHNDYDDAVRVVLAGSTRLMFLGKWYWIDEIAE